MKEKGHQISVMVKERENTTKLLDLYDIPFKIFGRTYPNRPSKAWGIIRNDINLIRQSKRFSPDITASIGGLYSVHAGACLGVPSIDFMDTEGAHLTNRLTFPFATVIATPDCYNAPVPRDKHLPYKGYHELAYLHPDYFTPDKKVLKLIDVDPGDYIVLRFSSWDASHQEGEAAMTWQDKIELTRELAKHKRVLVDTEADLPLEIEKYRLKIPDNLYHHVLAFSSIYVGEGATAASEAGILGVPWIFVSKKTRCYLEDQSRRYGLGKILKSKEATIKETNRMLQIDAGEYRRASKKLINEKIDVTSWMIKLTERLYQEHNGGQ